MSSYNRRDMEKSMRNHWEDIDLLSKLEEQNKDGEAYFLLDGPPFANNIPHVGHIRNTVYKDLFLRYAYMKGKKAFFQPGFDTHGLPIENMVQKEADIETKEDIEELGAQKFMELCRDHATRNKDYWLGVYEDLGSWYSWKEPYITYENDYLESVWNVFKTIYDKDLVYQGKKPVYWCPVDQTTMAGYEVTDSYKMVEDPMVIVKYPVKNKEDEYILIYTTTPWTLPSNTFIAAHPEETYVKAKTESEGTLILAEERLELLDDLNISYDILEEFPGSALEGLEYDPVIECSAQRELAKKEGTHQVYMSIPILKERVSSKTGDKKGVEAKDVFGHFVTVDSGTGLVHCAPGHGKSDYEVGKHYDLPNVSPLDDACKYTEDVEPYQGIFVKDADPQIVEDLETNGYLLHHAMITHKYPVSWRSEAPLIFRLSDQWFMNVEDLKDKMLTFNDEVNWQPSFAHERFKNWLEQAEDWNFTRQRYWGVPVPIYVAEDGDVVVIGSEEELRAHAEEPLPDDFDLHLASTITLEKDGKKYEALGDVFDVWFDSGSVPFGSLHYPFENEDLFDEYTPVARINEAQDQIRGWFYSLMYISTAAKNQPPYETVSMTGWVLDKHGDKMSKSKGNFVPVPELLETHGADNIRFYYCWDADPSQELKFNEDTIKNESGKALQTLENIYSYVASHTENTSTLQGVPDDLAVEDKWLLSRLATTVEDVRNALDEFEVHEAGRAIYDFILNDMSRSYIQLVRDRLVEGDQTPLSVLYEGIKQSCVLLAPITPHLADHVYQALTEGEQKPSVHLERYPEKDDVAEWKDERLEYDFETAQRIISAGLAARDVLQRGIRWPSEALIIDTDNDEVKRAAKRLKDLIVHAVNVEELRFEDVNVPVRADPHYASIGKDHQQNTQDVANLIREHAEELRDRTGATLNGYTIHPKYYEIHYEQPEGYGMSAQDTFKAFIAEEIPAELRRRGIMREVLRRIQVLRKDAELDKKQRIDVTIKAPTEVQEGIKESQEYFESRAGIKTLSFQETNGETYDIAGHNVTIHIDV